MSDSNIMADPVPVELPYISPQTREFGCIPNCSLPVILSPWSVQNITYELIQTHMITNPPLTIGYPITAVYDLDPKKSGIFLSIGYDHKTNPIGQRPAIIITRSDVSYVRPTMGQTVRVDPYTGAKTKLFMLHMQVNVACISTNVGSAEVLAEYIKQVFLYHEEQIRDDFKFSKYKLAGQSKPVPYPESKDSFVVYLTLETVFVEGATVVKDALKLNKVSITIFDGLQSSVPLLIG